MNPAVAAGDGQTAGELQRSGEVVPDVDDHRAPELPDAQVDDALVRILHLGGALDGVVDGVGEQEVEAHAVEAFQTVGADGAVQGDVVLLAQGGHVAQQDIGHIAARAHGGGVGVHRLAELLQVGQLHLAAPGQGLDAVQHMPHVMGGHPELGDAVFPLLVLLLGVGQQAAHNEGLGALLLPPGDVDLDDKGEHAPDDGVNAHGGLTLDAAPGVVGHQTVDADAQHGDGGGQHVQVAAARPGADVPGEHHIDKGIDRREHHHLQRPAEHGGPPHGHAHRRNEPEQDGGLVGDVLGGEPGHAGGGHGGGVALEAVHRAGHPPGHQQEVPQKPGQAGVLGNAGDGSGQEHDGQPCPGQGPPALPRGEGPEKEPFGDEYLKQVGEGLQMREQGLKRLKGESHLPITLPGTG